MNFREENVEVEIDGKTITLTMKTLSGLQRNNCIRKAMKFDAMGREQWDRVTYEEERILASILNIAGGYRRDIFDKMTQVDFDKLYRKVEELNELSPEVGKKNPESDLEGQVIQDSV